LSAFAQEYFNKSYSPYIICSPNQYCPVNAFPAIQNQYGYLMAGTYADTSNRYLYLIQTDINGDTLYTKRIGSNGEVYWPGYGQSLINTTNGGYLLAGTYKKHDTLDYDALLVRLSDTGDTLWQKTFGDSLEDQLFYGVEQRDMYYYACGVVWYNQGYEILLVKTDSLGNKIWEREYGGAGSQSASNIQITMDGNILISGYSGSGNNYNALAIKLDTAGNVLWIHSINTNGGGGVKLSKQAMEDIYISVYLVLAPYLITNNILYKN
jgi:hypothetical protein